MSRNRATAEQRLSGGLRAPPSPSPPYTRTTRGRALAQTAGSRLECKFEWNGHPHFFAGAVVSGKAGKADWFDVRCAGPPYSRFPDRHFPGFPRVCALSICISGTAARLAWRPCGKGGKRALKGGMTGRRGRHSKGGTAPVRDNGAPRGYKVRSLACARQVRPLLPGELDVLWVLVCARLVQSVCMSARPKPVLVFASHRS